MRHNFLYFGKIIFLFFSIPHSKYLTDNDTQYMIHVHVSHQIKQLCGLFFRKQINVKPISGIIFVASYYSAGFLLWTEFIGLLFMKSTSFLKSPTHHGLLRRTFRMNEKPIMYTIVNFLTKYKGNRGVHFSLLRVPRVHQIIDQLFFHNHN